MVKRGNVALGALVGAVSGLTASWLMMRFIQDLGPGLMEDLKSEKDHAEDHAEARARGKSGEVEPDSVTMQAADVFAKTATGGRHLTHEERAKGGTLVHYVFGTLMGVAYGMTAEVWELPTVGWGGAFGTVLWLGTDLASLPAVGFAKWPTEEPAAAHLTHWMSHLVYGVGLESTRRLLRSL